MLRRGPVAGAARARVRRRAAAARRAPLLVGAAAMRDAVAAAAAAAPTCCCLRPQRVPCKAAHAVRRRCCSLGCKPQAGLLAPARLA